MIRAVLLMTAVVLVAVLCVAVSEIVGMMCDDGDPNEMMPHHDGDVGLIVVLGAEFAAVPLERIERWVDGIVPRTIRSARRSRAGGLWWRGRDENDAATRARLPIQTPIE